MHSLIAFATQWGSKHGGINSFNTDFLKAFGIAFHQRVQVVCVVSSATDEEMRDAKNAFVTLVSLPFPPQEKRFTTEQAQLVNEKLEQGNIIFDPANTIWLGHDRITGGIANEVAKLTKGQSALIHHMSYDAYESFAEDSQTAYAKTQEQTRLFEQANVVLAVGPLLRDAASDMLGQDKVVHMLIPGLADDIKTLATPKTFVAFMSGRLSPDAARIKQGHLSIAAFAHAHKLACTHRMPEGLRNQPKLTLRGVDFEAGLSQTPNKNPEAELKTFAEKYAERAINLQTLPYTHNREELYENISKSSVVLMPSWHEGFGLTAWEAIAAGVPLIVSEQSGVYRLLDEKFSGTGTGCVYPIDIRGSNNEPYFQNEDLNAVAEALKEVASHPEKARQKAVSLRNLLIDQYTWSNCAEKAAKAFSWNLQRGSVPLIEEQVNTGLVNNEITPVAFNSLIVKMPVSSWKAGVILTDSQLLRAEEALVPFDEARQPELNKLDSWIDDTQYPQALRLVTGAGGLGKTRLALQLCQQRINAGWYAGFLDSNLLSKEINAGWLELKARGQPLLIVIDYAETRQNDLITLLKVVFQSPNSYPVRVLLLARDSGEWWNNLPAKDKTCEPFLSSYATSGPYEIPTLHTKVEDRKRAYRAAMQAFALALNGVVANVMPDLSAEHFGRPLYLQMSALLALRGERPSSAQGLTRALLNHERRYWSGVLAECIIPEPERYAEQLLAITTLAGGFATARDARIYWDRVDKDVLTAPQFNQLFEALKPLYPSKQGLQVMRPDLLGEALVAKILQKPESAQILHAVVGKDATSQVRLHSLTVLARLSNYYPELGEILIESFVSDFIYLWQEFLYVAKETPSELPLIAEQAFNRLPANIKSQLSGSLILQMNPSESVQLAIFDCLVRSYLTDKSRDKYLKKQTDVQVANQFATELGNYAISLSYAGQTDMALELAKQVLDIHQSLTSKNANNFAPDLARSLSNYASFLSNKGRNDEALTYAKQALEIRQRLVAKNPNRFELDLATSLNNYSNRLSDVGHNEEALAFAKQGLDILQRLADKNPDHFEPDLATSLNNYASHLSEIGRNDEALAYAKQALDIRQRLVAKNPDRFEPDLAISLKNYASHMSDIGRYDEALDFAKQALEIDQRLADKNPERFEPDLARSLNGYVNRLSEIGRNDEALAYAKQALDILQRLADKSPERYTEEFYISLCSTYFLKWIDGKLINEESLADINSLPKKIREHRQNLINLYLCFVQACCTKNLLFRTTQFEQVLELKAKMSQTDKLTAIEYWLCAATWCNKHKLTAVKEIKWQLEWQEFLQRKQGNIPHWMLVVSERLDFQWNITE